MNHKFLGEDDLVLNTSARIPVVLCIDTSTSMNKVLDPSTVKLTGEKEFFDGKWWDVAVAGDTLITEMSKGVNKFYDAIKDDEQASASCEIAIVSFSDRAKVISNFSSIEKKPVFNIEVQGDSTQMGAGIELALDLVQKRKNEYNKNAIEYYQPWLVLFTDGNPTDSIQRAQQRIQELEDNQKLTVFAIAIDDQVNLSILGSLSKRLPISMKNDKFGDFFEWLGKSVSVVSKSALGEQVELDMSKLDTWGEL